MADAPGIAGSQRPEVAGCFLAFDEFDAAFFIRMNNTGGPVDLWAVDGIDSSKLVEASEGFHYYPATIPRDYIRLVQSNVI